MKIILSIFFYFLILLPYSALLYKKVSVQIRLLFVSIFELFFLFAGVMIVNGLKIDLLIADMYFYNIFVWLSILINIFLILVIWITKYKA